MIPSPIRLLLSMSFVLLAGCASEPVRAPAPNELTPDEARALISRALPTTLADRAGWATDIHAAFATLRIAATPPALCAAMAVTEQESSYRANPAVPGLGAIAWREIDAKAEAASIPKLLVHTALKIDSSDGRSYAERIDAARTELELSQIFEDIIDRVPLGKRLFGRYNPVRTAGPMQVAIAFAEAHVRDKPYPYPIANGGSVRDEVFTRRGGLYFGIAHLLAYPADYDAYIYRYADFNAGHHASRNAALQNAISTASGVPLELDGDLIAHDADKPGATELAVRTLGDRLGMNDAAIRRALEQGSEPGLERSPLYRRVFELAEASARKPLPRAMIPRITLKSPKITRQLTTEWFARRVDERQRRCLARVAGG